jgi:hypothetical protein
VIISRRETLDIDRLSWLGSLYSNRGRTPPVSPVRRIDRLSIKYKGNATLIRIFTVILSDGLQTAASVSENNFLFIQTPCQVQCATFETVDSFGVECQAAQRDEERVVDLLQPVLCGVRPRLIDARLIEVQFEPSMVSSSSESKCVVGRYLKTEIELIASDFYEIHCTRSRGTEGM